MVFFATGGCGLTPVSVSVTVALLPPALAVIFTVPALRPVTLPVESTVARSVSEELQLTDAEPPAGSVVTDALSCRVCVEDRSMDVSPEIFTFVTFEVLQAKSLHVLLDGCKVSPFQICVPVDSSPAASMSVSESAGYFVEVPVLPSVKITR